MLQRQYSPEQRRALNLIWAAAGRYDLDPPFMAFEPGGQPSFYFNCVVGLAAKWLDLPRLEAFFASYAGSSRQEAFDELVWLGLENCVYEKELPVRPILASLRQQYALDFFAHQQKMSRQQWMAKNNRVYEQQQARWAPLARRRGPLLTPRAKELSQALALPGTLDTDEVIARLQGILRDFFQFSGSEPARTPFSLHVRGIWAGLLTKLLPTEIRHTDQLVLRRSSQLRAANASPAGKALLANHLSVRRAEADRVYMETCFGRSLYNDHDLAALEETLCTGNHSSCHLWITRGEPSPNRPPDQEAKQLARDAARQRQRNLDFYARHSQLYASSIRRLSEQLQDALHSYTQPQPVRARSGHLDSRRVWRAPCLQDPVIFLRQTDDVQPDLSVDLLLDASASRLNSQELIAAQGYILAESLRRCGVKVQIFAFRSLRGYTVLQLLKGYQDPGCRSIFDYFAAGWNRDGLALRTAAHLANSGCQHRLLLILTDASPNDSQKIPPSGGIPFSRDYGDEAAVADTAAEVKALRKQGFRVGAIFFGLTQNVPFLKNIYGSEFVRIQKIDQLAGAVGALLQRQLREMD
ncbi:hypothetical protein INF35_06575 [Subdoligranulum sp. DSM 109015]|uniref:Nitric oxide reductase activation protein n=1 Tax=Gemmiger gallinarum TaxID=2779354 RepID=A0ABR9R2Q5_9FIRM|nr:hypothetical protein [Gemmiger gallinarum]MBE5037443.1 hypothetical protein [Gemmiger gallinarum]